MKIKIDNSSFYSFNAEKKTLDISLNDRYFSLFRVIDDSFIHFSQIPDISIEKIHAFKKSLYPFLNGIKNNSQAYPVHFQITFENVINSERI